MILLIIMSVYAIRSLCTTEFYGFRRVSPDESKTITKVVYFRDKKDAEKFASFLKEYKHIMAPQLYEYEETKSYKSYKKEYSIFELPDGFMKLMLGMSGLGYHECKIHEDQVYCIDTGILDVCDEVKVDVFESIIRG